MGARALYGMGALLLLIGCGSDSGGPGARNAGENQPVNLALESFEVNQNLDWTAYPAFLRGLNPQFGPQPGQPDSEEPAAIVADVARVMQPLLAWQPSTDSAGTVGDFASVRNSVDLMSNLIYSDTVGNFQEGRRSIGDAIDRGEPARYQNDRIRFTTNETASDGTTLAPWTFILAWVYVAEAEGDDPTREASEDILNREIRDAVIRVILATSSPGSQISIFDAREFRVSGPQAVPDAQITSFTRPAPDSTDAGVVDPGATLNQSWVDQEDLWTWTSSEPESFGSLSGIRCAHLRVDYAGDKAWFYTSTEPSRVGLDAADPDATTADNTGVENPLCGAREEDGSYRPADRSWALDPANSLTRQ